MPISEDEMIVSTQDFLVTENKLNPRATPDEIAEHLAKWKTCGQVTLTTHLGGVRGVVVVERTLMSEDQSEKVRELMGMEDDEDETE